MREDIMLNLPALAVGQILDALYLRLETWEYTEEYLNTGLVCKPYCIEECSDSNEARQIADYYKEIIGSIEEQTDLSDGYSVNINPG